MATPCYNCGEWIDHYIGHRCKPITPPKGERMPDTKEYWEKRAAMDLELIMEMKKEISRLKQANNNLKQKINSFKKGEWP